ncbi:MAG: peptide ABC transporter substrate-binding protein [Candidatus Eremiobacteraeota bacterium]|nr:peptide ABC transporter substrate-binding protein [Candidatus Eremiobacteraeota bacterium]
MKLRCFLFFWAALLAVAGCTKVGTVAEGSRHPWTQPHVLRMADIADPDRFNPLLSTMDLVEDLSSLTFSYLIIADANGKLVGDLATEVPNIKNGGISKDGRTYIYHLHRAVKWHDNADFTSRDVKFTWQTVVNPNNNVLHREGYDRVNSIDTPDKYTLVVHLKDRYPPFVTKFFTSLQEGAKGILPEHLLGKLHDINQAAFNAQPVGTGPFKFATWERARRVVLVRNDRYFKGRPKLAKVILNVVPDDNTILNQVKEHSLDLVVSPPASLYDQYRSIPDVVTSLVPWNAENIFIINHKRPGLRHLEVRKAITMAIDYDALITKVTHGVGAVAHDIVPAVAIGYTNNKPYLYDPAAANKLLDETGWKVSRDGVRSKGGERLDFGMHISNGSANGRLIAVQMQQYFRAVGIALSIKTYPYNVIFSHDGPIYTFRYDFANYSYTLPYDPDNLFYIGCDQIFPKGENIYHYCDAQVDAAEKAGLGTDDLATRARIYHKAEARIHETVPYIPLYVVRRVTVHSPDLKGFSASPTIAPWWNAWQWDI